MNKLKNTLYIQIIMLSIFAVQTSKAQDGESDLASWTSIGIEYELNDKLTFGLEQHIRSKENISVVDNYFTEFNTEYEFFKDFKLGVGFRFISDNDNQGAIQGYEDHFRFNFDASFKHDINKFTLGYRLRYQNKNELGLDANDGDFENQNVRFKTSVEYNISNWKLDPKFSAEIFNKSQKYDQNGFNKYRLTLGTDYKTKNFGKIGAFYSLEKQLNVDLPETTNIIGLKYTYTIKNNK